MNNHAFAQGRVFNKPGHLAVVFSRVLVLLYLVWTKLMHSVKACLVWSLSISKASFGDGCMLSENAFIYNSGPKDNVKIGSHVVCRGILRAEQGGKIIIGNDVYIGDGCILSARNEIEIGDNVLIAHMVSIFDNDSHPMNYLERRVHFRSIIRQQSANEYKYNILNSKVTIEDDVWLGLNSIILKGVTVGKGAVVGAGSVITKDVSPYTVVAGNPARVIGVIEQC